MAEDKTGELAHSSSHVINVQNNRNMHIYISYGPNLNNV